NRARELISSESGATHQVAQLPRDSDTRCSGTENDDALPLDWRVRRTTGRQNPSNRDRGGSLDVIVERRQHLAISIKQVECVLFLEVLPLQQRPGKPPLHRMHEFINQSVIFLASKSRR